MKPLFLTMQAFGSFSNKETIDFSILKNRSLFLIHGPTGSGKTTILDAICFALYGESSGKDRAAYIMRSDFSDESLQTEVSLTFSIGKEIYRVLRIPEQERIKRRGTGVTKRAAEATLWKVNSTEDNSEENIIADRWSRVTEKIEVLLGFRSDQFRQVVILPQGDFRRLLSANSQERQEILTILFKTGRFKLFEDELKEAAKTIRTQYENLSNQLQFQFRDSNVNSLEELSDLIAATDISICTYDNDLNTTRNEEQSALKKLTEAKEINARFTELDDARKNFDLLTGEKESFEKLSQQIDLLEKALLLENEWNHCIQIEKDLKKIQEEQKDAEIKTEQYKKAKQQYELVLNNALEKNSFREKHIHELNLLKQAEPKLLLIEKHRSNNIILRNRLNEVTDQKENKKVHLEKVRTALQRIQDELSGVREAALLTESRKQKILDIEKFISEQKKLDELKISLKKILSALEKADNDYLALVEKIDKCKADIEEYDRLRQEYQIAAIAGNLSPGLPCPVCGSTEHPAPALSNTLIPDDQKLVSVKEHLKQLENDKEKQRKIIEQQQIAAANLKKEISLISEAHQNSAFQEVSSVSDLLKIAKESFNESLEAVKRIEKLTNDKSRGEIASANTEKELENLSNSLSEINAELLSSETMLKSLEADVPSEYQNVSSITNLISKKEDEIKQLETAVEKARKEFEFYNEQYIMSRTALQKQIDTEAEMVRKVESVKSIFSSKIQENGLTDLDHFIAVLNRKATLQDNKQKLQNFNMKLHTADERLQRANEKCKGYSSADSSSIENLCKDLQAKIDSLTNQIASLKQKREYFYNKKESVIKIKNEIESLEKRFGTAGKLHEIASGNNPLRMTFERFILSSLLDEVLFAGTQRLKIMSCGRFEMHRARSNNDLRTSGGLDLQIFDSYTGTSRPVASLSGGESFLAALSLALGLADIVQSHAGGIRLETIFIDEGFGSLDPEALDLAFQALSNLGQGGRLVGIISHVSELRERINTRLELISGKKGSSTRFVI